MAGARVLRTSSFPNPADLSSLSSPSGAWFFKVTYSGLVSDLFKAFSVTDPPLGSQVRSLGRSWKAHHVGEAFRVLYGAFSHIEAEAGAVPRVKWDGGPDSPVLRPVLIFSDWAHQRADRTL